MQSANYPEYYDVKFQTGYHGNETTKTGIYITKCLIKAITKNVRPLYDPTNKAFYSPEDYRIRIEATEHSGRQYYVLDVGQNFQHYDVDAFKAKCQEDGSVSPDIAYCDNVPGAMYCDDAPSVINGAEKSGVAQKRGIIKVYAMKGSSYSTDTGKRIANNIALAYITAINELDDHFIVTDTEAFRLL